MKLLVHHSRETAQMTIKTLGLDPEQWQPCGYMDTLDGQQLDQVVVVWWESQVTPHVRRWMKEDLPLKLPPGKQVEFL
jgi:hypothetical protein